jgi:asparagine synthase (glutamine-hydrolysing)
MPVSGVRLQPASARPPDMCGICGVMALDGPLDPTLRKGVRAMNAALAHRGPDGDGFRDEAAAVLGHRRLAIIDRAGGSQPMSNEDGSCWVVFNGEIYNHRTLRPVLEARGHRFRTVSDTETIVHAWEEYGTGCVERLDGMFAFAVYDTRKRELFIARDRLGKKPLFYTILDGVLHFASELGALRASPAWRGDLDLSALEGYLSLGYFLAPNTAYRDVRKLEPGCWLHVAKGRVVTTRYWDVTEFGTDHRSDGALIADLEATLGAAVRNRLESEVPLGAFLSGGIDSGLVVSFMAESLADPVVTTTVGFADAAHNELEAAALTAAYFHTRHHEQVVAPRLEEVFDGVVDHLGEPMADSSAIPTWYVSQKARRHVTVALSGDGGDETFAGYDFRYVPHVWESRARTFVPGAPGRRLARWLGAQWPRARALPRPLRLGTIFENLSRDPAAAYFLDLCFLKPPDARALLGLSSSDGAFEGPIYEAVTEPYRRCPSPDPLQRAQYADLKVYMPNDPLVKVDRMSMAHSLEIRCPLLDRHVVELAFRIPAARKQRGRTGKVLLRELARRRLPAAHATLPKRGFTVPIGEWICGPYRQQFTDDVLGSGSRVNSILDTSVVRRLMAEFQPGMASHAYALWAVWLLEKWLRSQQVTALDAVMQHG